MQAKTFHSPNSVLPETNLLSNGNYTVMLPTVVEIQQIYGAGCNQMAEDSTLDNWGMMFYIANLNSIIIGQPPINPFVWSRKNIGCIGRIIVYNRKDGNIETRTEVVVSPEFNGEVRSITLTNHGKSGRMMEATIILRLCCIPILQIGSSCLHQPFRSEYLPERETILVSRRPGASRRDCGCFIR